MDPALRADLHPQGGEAVMRLHEGDGIAHVHELALDQKGKLTEHIWKIENVELTTVGIDIGSSTSHLMFASVRLQRKTQSLSSQFVVVDRKVIWKSPILLTPFLPDATIDAARLGAFIAGCYAQAGLAADAIDTGAVILTGEAIKRSNARAIAELFAADSGKFVCASAGHHLECALAAHGSGAVALSRDSARAILNVDIGGGTTKLALIDNGRIAATCAFAIGGRLIAFDPQGRLTRIDESGLLAAHAAGVELKLGEIPDPEALQRVTDALADAAIALIRGEPPTGLARRLLLTDPLAAAIRPQGITFSGGVSEYIYGREARGFGDIAAPLAARVANACASGRIAIAVSEPREGIRATVIGASQFTVQVSGKTIHISAGASLPLRNVPVISPVLALEEEVSVAAVAQAIQAALARAPVDPARAPAGETQPIALAIHWRGEPCYERLRGLAEGIALALAPRDTRPEPLILMIDGDVGGTLGHILEHELCLGREVISIDGIQLKEFDFVDIGEVIRPADVVPVVIKSLLFPGAPTLGAKSADTHYKPLQAKRSTAR
jgi:ethanolamine utilization protein EutA (predicted chaperonin)